VLLLLLLLLVQDPCAELHVRQTLGALLKQV
jgi:hypothetical protein